MSWLARKVTTTPRLLLLVLALFGVILGLAVAAGELLKLAERRNGSTPFDSSITSWAVAHRTHGLTTLARALSTIGSQLILAPAVGLVVVFLVSRRRVVLTGFLVAAWGGALLLYSLTKHFVHRSRPPAHLWLTKVAASSFPSGHATQSLATLFALALVGAVLVARSGRPARTVAVVLAAAIGCSRVYLGVHWSTDVIAGWVIAAAWITVVLWLTALASRTVIRNG